ncbi:MAG: hypothetical protein KAI79_15050, partial [Bacteroidales bacterium]|nr:hypothetical protein [Bacteroidales bacterium]
MTKSQLKYSNIELNQSDSLLFIKEFKNTNSIKNFDLSLIEIGANGCIPCRRMDTVLVEIKEIYGDEININFYNVSNKDGKKAAKYFGI